MFFSLRPTLPSIAAALLLTLATSHAAPAQPAPNAVALQQRLESQDRRVALLRDELRSLDSRIESRVDSIVEALRAIGDSKDTRSKVTRMKRDTIERLKRNLDYFRQKRAALQEELRRPTWNLSAEEKQTIIAKFDARIEKRVNQILALEKSLPTEKDYDRYVVTGSTWDGPTYALNEDFRQNQRLTSQTDAQRKETLAAFDRSIAQLESQNRALQARTTQGNLSTDASKVIQAEIAKNNELIKTRRAQRADVLRPTATPTRAIGSKEAQTLDAGLNKALEELRREFTTLFSLYHQIIAERSAANTTRAALVVK